MSIVNNQTDIYVSPTLEPNFSWQVGFNNFNAISSGVTFRITTRPLTNLEQFTRIPNSTVNYEETGVLLNGLTSLGFWQFTFAKNLSSSGGPHRDYQVVVEAHDSAGNTSAGNMIGTYGNNENGWPSYPNGYDIVAIKNPRPSGIELSFNIPTQTSSTGLFIASTGSSYQSQQYMGANGEIVIKFTSGTFPSGIVGGYLYTSATQFPKKDIFAPTSFYGSRVEQTRFDFDVNNPYVYSPHAAFNVRGAPYCFTSISFYDEIDDVLINNGIDVSTGLYMSNNVPIYNDGAAGSLTMGGVATFFTVQTTGYPIISGARWSGLIGSGSTEVARVSTDGTLNVPQNITTIFYMALGITGFYTGFGGGTPGGIGGSSTQNVTGRTPGGYSSGTLVCVGFDSSNSMVFKSITGLKLGDTVVSYIMPNLTGTDFPYNALIDNWQTAHYSLTGLISASNSTGNFASGIITNLGSSNISGSLVLKSNDISDGINISFEQPIFIATGNTISDVSTYTGKFLDGNTILNSIFSPQFSGINIDSSFFSYFVGFNKFSFDINAGLPFSHVSSSTGLFYYIDVQPFNTFFITSPGAVSVEGILTHNSLYNY